MKLNNRKETALILYGLFFLLILDILFLLFAKNFTNLDEIAIYTIFIIVFIVFIWRIIILKTFSMEVTEHILSIKYYHPLLKNNRPVLEVPLHKIVYYKTQKAIINYIMILGINTKRGVRNFHYRLGRLPKNQSHSYKEMYNLISRIKSESSI